MRPMAREAVTNPGPEAVSWCEQWNGCPGRQARASPSPKHNSVTKTLDKGCLVFAVNGSLAMLSNAKSRR